MAALHNLIAIDAPGEVLSPTSVTGYRRCAAQWKFKRIDRLPDPKSGALLQGSCVDAALTENFRQKVETHRDLPAAGVAAIYRESWATLEPETAFHDDEIPAQLKAEGEALALKYLDEVACEIEPAAVQVSVEGVINGVRTRGFIDLLDIHGTVIDIKTAKRTPSEVSSDYRLQVASYTRLEPRASGAGRVDTLVKNKTPKLVQQTFTVDAADFHELDALYPAVQHAIRSRFFLPNRANYMCSRKYCSFWRQCQSDWGGRVAE